MCQTKVCAKCKEEKKLENFHNCSLSKDKKVSKCKECVKLYTTDYNKTKNTKTCTHCHCKKNKNSFKLKNDICIKCKKSLEILINIKCSSCKEFKNFEHFSKNKNTKTGFCYTCKQCTSIKNKTEEKRTKNRVKQNNYNRKRFFYSRACTIRNRAIKEGIPFDYSINELCIMLAKKWKYQLGFCALTGDRLNRDNSNVDHIIPIAKGGQFNIENLQWVTKEVNKVKGVLTVEDLIILCTKIIQHQENKGNS
jgi:hypothetical protein